MKKNITPNTVQVVEDEDGSACKTIKVKVTDVDWDVEEQDLIDSMKGDPNDPSQVKMEIDTVKLNLNKRLESDPYVEVEYCPGDDLDELVGDAISEKFGWLVNGFNFDVVDDAEKVDEEFDTEDGWDCDEIRDSGLMDTLRKCANLQYTLDKCTRASANFGETLGDLKAYVNELAEEMQNAVADFPDGEMLEEDDEQAAPSGPPYFEEACEVDELIAMYFSDLAYVSKMKWTQFLDNLEQRPGDEYLTDFCEWAWGDGVKMSQEDMDFVKERLNEFFDDGELENTWKKSSPAEKEGVEEAIPRTLKDIDAAKAKNIIAKALKAGTGEWEGQPELSDFVYQTASGKYMLLRKGWGDHWETGRVSL